MEIAEVRNGDDFRRYVEEKYKGKVIKNQLDGKDIEVKDIADLAFDDLTLEEKKLCVHPQVAWGMGVMNSPYLNKVTKIKGYMFRPNQQKLWVAKEPYIYFEGAYGCIDGETKLYDAENKTEVTIKELYDKRTAIKVLSYKDGEVVKAQSTIPVKYPVADLYKVKYGDKVVIGTAKHRFLTASGWKQLSELSVGEQLLGAEPSLRESTSGISRLTHLLSADRLKNIALGFQSCCRHVCRLYDGLLHRVLDSGLNVFPLQADVHAHSHSGCGMDGRYSLSTHNQVGQQFAHLSRNGLVQAEKQTPAFFVEDRTSSLASEDILQGCQSTWKSALNFFLRHIKGLIFSGDLHESSSSYTNNNIKTQRVQSISYYKRDNYYDIHIYGTNNYLAEGVFHHNSSKTTFLLLKAINLCVQYPGTRVVVIRDTYPNLVRTTLASLTKIFEHFGWKEDVNYRHHKADHSYYINTGNTYSTLLYMAAKNEGTTIEQAIKDFGSLEVDAIFIDEARDIDEPIYLACTHRLGRWGKINNPKDVQMVLAGNPADPEHYLALRFEHGLTSNKEPIPDFADHKFTISTTYENRRNHTQQYIKSLEARPEYFKQIYLYGKRGFYAPDGEPVYPNFNHDRYVSGEPLMYLKGQPLIRGWDLGPTGKYKAVVIAQRNPGGQLLILRELLSDEPGIENFGRNVLETCNMFYPEAKGAMDYVDPATFHTTQTDIQSPSMILAKLGIGCIAGETSFPVRKDAVVQMMSKDMYNNLSPMLIDPCCTNLINGFMGGYYYKSVDPNTGRTSTSPVKNKYSHVADALQYLCSKLAVQSRNNKNKFLNYVKSQNAGLYQRVKNLNRKIVKPRNLR